MSSSYYDSWWPGPRPDMSAKSGIEVDDDLVTNARSHLAAAGIGNVTVLRRAGALGHADAAPYDRIVATVGAHGVRMPGLINSALAAGCWCRSGFAAVCPARSVTRTTTANGSRSAVR
jgi:hypothetical protein